MCGDRLIQTSRFRQGARQIVMPRSAVGVEFQTAAKGVDCCLEMTAFHEYPSQAGTGLGGSWSCTRGTTDQIDRHVWPAGL